MWFKVLSIIIGCICLITGILRVIYHDKVYRWARRLYAAKSWSATFTLLTACGVVLLAAIWYATVFHYTEHCWLVTLFAAAGTVKAFSIIFRWKDTSTALVKFIDADGLGLWLLDALTVSLGIAFLLLGLFVYG